MIILDMLDI